MTTGYETANNRELTESYRLALQDLKEAQLELQYIRLELFRRGMSEGQQA